jgi:predicted nucleic-acid-binding Zn-ribbon protein
MTDKLYYTGQELNKPLYLDKLKYIVTGTGRCGTVYVAKLLSSIGIPCTHEAIFQHDGLNKALERLNGQNTLDVSEISKLASYEEEEKGISWFNGNNKILAESSYMAAPFLDHEYFKDVTVIHVIRKPMRVINSFVSGLGYFKGNSLYGEAKEYHEFIYKHIPRLRESLPPQDRAALYYIKWNEMIKQKAQNYFLYRIEHPPTKLLKFIGLQRNNYYTNTQSNHKIGLSEEFTRFSQIKTKDIREELINYYSNYYLKTKLM